MRVKICGITNLQDALEAIDAGADALGFVFYKASPRYISPIAAFEIIELLPPFVESVGLFVNESAQEINTMAEFSRVSRVQLHFETNKAFRQELNRPSLPVIRAQSAEDIAAIEGFALVDAYTDGYGGEGKRLNLEWFDGVDCSNFILAGGLDPENISDIVSKYNFFGVDVSSGVELEKGVKDPQKLRDFIARAKQC